MKKALSILLVAVMLLSLCPAVFAEGDACERPVLPDGHPEDHIPDLPRPGFAGDGSLRRGSGGFSVSIAETGRDSDQTISWRAKVTGASGSFQYRFLLLGLFEPPYTVVHIQEYSDSDTYRYQFHMSGDYTVMVMAKESATGDVSTALLDVHLATSSKLPSVNQVAKALVDEGRAAGCKSDYEIALWLHDWLTGNANYDYTYSYYGPDGVLCCGTGVCDSYSKAYFYLLEAAGIPVDRVVNSNHAWNVVQLDNAWYYVDVTWDDPNEGGYEHHRYFCLPDEILKKDHSGYTCPYVCDSYDDNYFARSGDGKRWADDLAAKAQNGLLAGHCVYTVPLADSYLLEGHQYSQRPGQWAVLADNVTLTLAQKRSYRYEGERISLTMRKAKTSDSSACMILNPAGRSLTLPENLTRIGEEAFRGDSRTLAVTIPSRVAAIGSRAFADCGNLWFVSVPSSVVNFGSGVFDCGSNHFTLIVEEGSRAEQYARQNNIRYIYAADIPSSTEADDEHTWIFE